MSVPGHNELYSLLTVEDEVNNMMKALKLRKIALDQRTPLLRAAQLHFCSLAQNQVEYTGVIPLEVAKYLASTDYELKQRASTSKQSEPKATLPAVEPIDPNSSTATAIESELNMPIATTKEAEESLLNASVQTTLEPEGENLLDMSVKTAVKTEDEFNMEAEKSLLNASVETALEPEGENPLNSSITTAVEPEKSLLNDSVATAIEGENLLDMSVKTAVETEDELNSSTVTSTAAESEGNFLDMSAKTAVETEDKKEADENKKKENDATWVEQLKKIRDDPAGDHTQQVKKILKEMKSAWF